MAVSGPRNTAAESAFGPTLPELLGPRLRALRGWQRVLLAALAIAVLGVAIALLVRSQVATKTYHQSAGDATARGLAPIPFHFDHSRRLPISKPPGTYVKAERRVGGT